MGAGQDRQRHVAAWVEAQLVIVGAADDVLFVGRVDRNRGLVARAGLLAIRVNVRASLRRRCADQVAGVERRTGTEDRAGHRRRGVVDAVGEGDRFLAGAFFAHDGHETCAERQRRTREPDGSPAKEG